MLGRCHTCDFVARLYCATKLRRALGARLPRNWVHKKIPGCAVELNTQNCAWFGSQISLITAMSFWEAMPPEPPTRGSAPGPRWGTSVLQTPYAPHIQILATTLALCNCGGRCRLTLQFFSRKQIKQTWLLVTVDGIFARSSSVLVSFAANRSERSAQKR